MVSIWLRYALATAAIFVASFGIPVMAASLDAENLLTPMPKGFLLGSQTPDGNMQEFIKPPETVDNWTAIITVNIFHQLKNFDPRVYANRMSSMWKSSCDNASVQTINEGAENGFPVIVWMYICPLNSKTQKPETMWLKAIGGADSLYSVQYASRLELSKEVITPAMEFLRHVFVCDTRRPDRPCPELP